MRILYLTFNPFSDPIISHQCDSIQVSLREDRSRTMLLISTTALFPAYTNACNRVWDIGTQYAFLNE